MFKKCLESCFNSFDRWPFLAQGSGHFLRRASLSLDVPNTSRPGGQKFMRHRSHRFAFQPIPELSAASRLLVLGTVITIMYASVTHNFAVFNFAAVMISLALGIFVLIFILHE